MQEHFVDYYICSVQSENLDDSGIVLREVRIPTLVDRVRILTLRVRAQSENRDKVSVFIYRNVNMYFS